jgi:cytoskeletal protein CcmA (bactofilin family)
MAGYTRQDTANNIANGNVIDADDFDAEYNAIESAFNASTGHSHDGTTGSGAPIEKVGPSQDLIVSATKVEAKQTNTLDLGSDGVQFKDGFFDGTLNTDVLTVDETATFTGAVTANSTLSVAGATGIDGNFDINTDKFTVASASGNTAIAGTLDVTGASTLASLSATTIAASGAVGIDGNFDINTDKFTVTAASGNTSIAGTLDVTGTITGDVSGDLTGNVSGDVTGDVTGNVTGTVSSLSNHDTDDLSEGATNQYYTDARARGSISVTDSGGDGSLAYNSGTGVITYTGPSATETRAHFSEGEGISISSGVISGENASASNKGIASFNSTDFNTTAGAVGLKTERVQDIVGDMVTGNTETGLSVTYNDDDGKLNFVLTKDPTITLTGAVTGSGTMTNLGSVSIATTATADPTLTLSGHVTGSATFTNLGDATLSATVSAERIQDVVGAMVSGNTESGISVTYVDSDGTLDFAHTNTSSQNSVDNSGNTVIQDIAVDTYGHVTSIGSKTIDTMTNSEAIAAQKSSNAYVVGHYMLLVALAGSSGAFNGTLGGGSLAAASCSGHAYRLNSNTVYSLNGSWRRMGYQESDGTLTAQPGSTRTTLWIRYA